MPPDYAILAVSDADAAERFGEFRNLDPLPSVQPSLLNSADSLDYVRLTGMVHPFDETSLKSASYEADIWGRCIWWDETGIQHEKNLVDDETFTLAPNSIAFVEVAPIFRLPNYIAIRFNLKITHVHRGLLLGTGPLVDPGFHGKLLIPLHNLTTNEYTFRANEGLIWIEFTKTSPNPIWQSPGDAYPRVAPYKPFPARKIDLKPVDYFAKASQNRPIRSSIPSAIQEGKQFAQAARDAATDAAQEARTAQRRILGIGIVSTLVLLLTLAGVTYQTWTLIHEIWSVASSVKELSQRLETAQTTQSLKITDLERSRSELLSEIQSLRASLARTPKSTESQYKKK
jgi:deoxycytidine triphosphate deaminase